MTDPGCLGKRHYATKPKALRGLKALAREARKSSDPRGYLSVYQCDCGRWCIRRGYDCGAPEHKRRPEKSREDFGKGALLFARAERIAKERFPDGANAAQLARILREVLAA